MGLFAPRNSSRTPRHEALHAAYEIAHTCVDFSAALLFLVGSVLFLYPDLETPAIWCFIVGSFFFAMKPTLRLAREIHYLTLGDIEDVAERART